MSNFNFKNTKSIQFDLTLNGKGIVNFDSSEQLDFLSSVGIVNYGEKSFYSGGKALSNVLFSKKNFRKTEDGKTEYHVKVSSECLRNAIFKNGMPAQSPTIMALPNVLYRAIAHPDSLLRGYMYTESGKGSIKRKSPLYITDAEEIGEWRTSISTDFHSRSGEKELSNGKDENSAKDNTIYKIENVGDVTYKCTGGIDLQELAFISADPIYDRMAVEVDGGVNEEIYINALKENFPNSTPEFKYYYLKNAYTADEWAERGILLDTETVNQLVKHVLKNILNIYIIKRNAYLKADKLTLKVFTDEGVETVDVNLNNIDSLNFDFQSNYLEADFEKIKANKEEIEKKKSTKKNSSKK
jgi:hypothetical protein